MADIGERRSRERRREDYSGFTFKVIKFRTMVNEAEKSTGPVWAKKNDPRITKFGNFLRKSRIDEIPQFLNVLKGEMALVGPRPERPSFVSDLSQKIDGYSDRLQVKPGITGLAQVESGYDTSVSSVINKVRHDLDYINRRSFWLDIKILLKTVIVVFTGKGAN
jgi:lipopolysaccharide/colanic/teichoic acid biosynthesis glycosyltransferase